MPRFLLGLDIGSSSVKASLVDAETGQTKASAQSPAEEMEMTALQPGWAEQSPELWWKHLVICVRACFEKGAVRGEDVVAIGISYQMHGLVLVDANQKALRPSIIWCDSRAVEIGEKAFKDLGPSYCLQHYLNSPGNFTASKLRWVKENEPKVFEKIHKIMLPGDYIAMRLTGEIVTTASALSEGVFWDFKNKTVSQKLLDYYGFNSSFIPDIKPVFSVQGELIREVANELGLKAGTPIAYRSGDQPNNAFSLNVLNPGETAATAGTSGVIYSVTEKNAYDLKSRVNTFVHVNHSLEQSSNGVLLCINGTGILNSWLRKNTHANGPMFTYDRMNSLAAEAPIGSEGLMVLPFGNGAERILENKAINSSFHGLDFNRHTQAHIFRAAQEGIVFSLRYGFDILQEMGLKSTVIRAGNANMFLSPLFRNAFANTIGATLELYNTDGAKGAALGAGVGAGIYSNFNEAFQGLNLLEAISPSREQSEKYEQAYSNWKTELNKHL